MLQLQVKPTHADASQVSNKATTPLVLAYAVSPGFHIGVSGSPKTLLKGTASGELEIVVSKKKKQNQDKNKKQK